MVQVLERLPSKHKTNPSSNPSTIKEKKMLKGLGLLYLLWEGSVSCVFARAVRGGGLCKACLPSHLGRGPADIYTAL
jgi:hypothetical protein